MDSQRERENVIYMAMVAHKAERHDDMFELMKKVVKFDVELTERERNLFLVCNNHMTVPRRDSLRMLSHIVGREEKKGNEQEAEWVRELKLKVESELSEICLDMLALIDEHLLPSASAGEPSIFYCKMKADCYRYLAEFKTGDGRKEFVELSLKEYETAISMAEKDLSAIHPCRLGLVLNFSVFYYEIMDSNIRASNLIKKAYHEAISALPLVDRVISEESTSTLKLMSQNLDLWATETPRDGEETAKETTNDRAMQRRLSCSLRTRSETGHPGSPLPYRRKDFGC